MISFAILDHFKKLNQEYTENPKNWYAFSDISPRIHTYMINKNKDLYVLKTRADIPKALYTKVTLAKKLKKPEEEFKVRHIDEELLFKRKGSLADKVNSLLNNKKLNNSSRTNILSDTILEGPIYMNYNGKPIVHTVPTEEKKYLSLYKPGPKINLPLREKEEIELITMNKILNDHADHEQRSMYH